MFNLQAEVSEWLVQMVFKHLQIDPADQKEFNRIITDARFHETVLYLQEGQDDEHTAG
jgi:hypothetical protein